MRTGLVWKVLAVAGPTLVVAAVVGFVVLLVAGVMFRAWLGMRRARANAAAYVVSAPATPAPTVYPAVEWWAAGAYGLWTGGEDCATWTRERARTSLESWYGATDAAGLDRTIDGLMAGATGNQAWDQVRAIDLLRIGIAAGYVTREECADRVRTMAAQLRASYPSWEALGTAFEAGMHAWQDSRGVTDPAARGRVKHALPTMRSDVWPKIRYDGAL